MGKCESCMINYDLKKIKAIIFDVDGVLSCETVTMAQDGVPLRTANIKDGYAIQLAQKLGLRIVIMTGADTISIINRYESLGVKDLYVGCAKKVETYEKFKAESNLTDEEIMYMGDDIPDYEVMKRVGCPVCPKDACAEIKEVSLYVSHKEGGRGCGRDVIEQVLRAQGLWMSDETVYSW